MTFQGYIDSTGHFVSSSPIFAKLEILKLKDIFVFQISRFIHTCLNHDMIRNFHNWFVLNNEVHKYFT